MAARDVGRSCGGSIMAVASGNCDRWPRPATPRRGGPRPATHGLLLRTGAPNRSDTLVSRGEPWVAGLRSPRRGVAGRCSGSPGRTPIGPPPAIAWRPAPSSPVRGADTCNLTAVPSSGVMSAASAAMPARSRPPARPPATRASRRFPSRTADPASAPGKSPASVGVTMVQPSTPIIARFWPIERSPSRCQRSGRSRRCLTASCSRSGGAGSCVMARSPSAGPDAGTAGQAGARAPGCSRREMRRIAARYSRSASVRAVRSASSSRRNAASTSVSSRCRSSPRTASRVATATVSPWLTSSMPPRTATWCSAAGAVAPAHHRCRQRGEEIRVVRQDAERAGGILGAHMRPRHPRPARSPAAW